MDKLVVTSGGEISFDFTADERAQRDLDRQLAGEQVQLDLLIPPQEEIDQAEFELKSINLLIELGVI